MSRADGMDENYCNKQTFASIVKTILLFLENNNLTETASVFNDEIAKKLKNIRMDEVAPRTVILRPMDIKTNVDATISDENLIICISGKNIDVNGAGFDKNKDNPYIKTDSQHCFDAELFKNTENLLENHEEESLNPDKDVSKGEQETLSNLATSVHSSEKIQKSPVTEDDLRNVGDEKVDSEMQDPIEYNDALVSSNASTKDDENCVIIIEQSTIADESVFIEEINQTDSVTIMDSITQASKLEQVAPVEPSTIIQPMNTTNSSLSKLRPKLPPPKKYQAKSASPIRKSSTNSYSKPNASRLPNYYNPNCRPPKPNNDRVNKTPITSPKRPRSQQSTNFSQKTKLPVKPQPPLYSVPSPQPPKPVEIEEPDLTHINSSSNSSAQNDLGDNLKISNVEIDSGDASIPKVISDVLEQPPPEPPVESEHNLPLNVIAKPHPFCQLDYAKIKQDLFNGDCETKQKILQALRWRLTRTEMKVRDHNLVCYITNDLLEIGAGSDFFEEYFKQTKNCESSELQEEASRFINTLASMSMGREYLEKCPNLIQIFLPILMKSNKERVNFENLTRQFVMATIQKLSLGGRIRKLLINEGIVEWLIKYILTNHELMTDYEAEYSVALFSNLCIHKLMRDLCEIMADETAQLLNVLVYTPHKCCLPYLSGILGSLLTNDAINRRAADLNIQAKLKYLAEIADDDETKQQLEFIIQLHESSSQNKCMYDVVEEPQVYSDYLECELGMNESNYVSPVGERFLENYCASFPSIEKHVHVVKRSCSYGVNKRQSDFCETEHTNIEENSEVVSHLTANEQMSKIEFFKDMFNQVPLPSPPITTLCRLNYYNLNRPISIPVRYSSVAKSKYSCECYENIKNVLGEDTKSPRNLQNSGRKPNNVVYGPLISPKNYCSALSMHPCGIKHCCGVNS